MSVISEIERDYVHKLSKLGKRVDDRGADEYRKIVIERNVISTAEGSARVKLGNTDVLVGVKLDVGEPYPDKPEEGVLITSAELIPMASPTFESGPPKPQAIELARVVDRGVRESKAINLSKLCITEGEEVWMVFLDIHVLDYDGNLIDASGFGAIAALTTAQVPAERFEKGKDFKLPVEHYPIPCTYVKIGEMLAADPGLDEDKIAEARLTFVFDENNEIRAIQKGLAGAFTLEEVNHIIEKAAEVSKKNRKLIQ